MRLETEEDVNDLIQLSISSSKEVTSTYGTVFKINKEYIFEFYLMDKDTIVDLQQQNYTFKIIVKESFFDRYTEPIQFVTKIQLLDYTTRNLLCKILFLDIQGAKRKLILEGKILLLLQNLVDHEHHIDNIGKELSLPISVSQIQKAIHYIFENLDKKLSVAQIANEVGTNEMYLKSSFKSYTGETTYQFILKNRMGLAKQLIKKNDLTLTEVAMKVGFSSLSSFSQAFRKYHGVNPSQYFLKS